MSIQRINRKYWILAGLGAIVMLAIPFVYIDQLPDDIPMHFGVDGMPDRFGSKTGIWTLPIVGLVLFAIMTALGHYVPRTPRDAKKHTEAGHQELMQWSTHLVGVLNMVVTWLFAYIVYQTIMVALGSATGLGLGFLPIVLALILIPMGYICWKMSRLSK